MSNTDYSQLEIDSIIDELLGLRRSSLKAEEIDFIEACQNKVTLTQQERDVLIKLYDGVGEANY